MLNITLVTYAGLEGLMDFSYLNPVNVGFFIGFIVLAFIISFLTVQAQQRGVNIIGNRRYFYVFSGLLVGFLLAVILIKGINFGIDFKGGTMLQFGFKEKVTEMQLREAFIELSKQLNKPELKGAMIQEAFLANIKDYTKLFVVRTVHLEARDEIPKIKEYIQQKLGGVLLKQESVGPTISKELRRNALIALLVALVAQVIYIAFRFGSNIMYGIIADIALIHDVIVMIGIYALLGKEADSPFLAALLTVIGYSVMDSIVIFDRIRENLNLVRAHRATGFNFEKLVNDSVVQTLTRSVNTAITVLLTLIGIYFLGGETLKNFAFAIAIGTLSGAYSSIFLAAPMVVSFKDKVLPLELARLEQMETAKVAEISEAGVESVGAVSSDDVVQTTVPDVHRTQESRTVVKPKRKKVVKRVKRLKIKRKK